MNKPSNAISSTVLSPHVFLWQFLDQDCSLGESIDIIAYPGKSSFEPFFLFNWIHSISWCGWYLNSVKMHDCCMLPGVWVFRYAIFVESFPPRWTNNCSAYCLETFPVYIDDLCNLIVDLVRLILCRCPAQIFCYLAYHQGTLLSPVVMVQPSGTILTRLNLAQ